MQGPEVARWVEHRHNKETVLFVNLGGVGC